MLFLSFLVLGQLPIARESSTIDLGDFKTKAELSYPAGKTDRLPTVILVHGTGPSDMDASFPNAAIFKALATDLSGRGYAVLRYNKHYVNGPRDFDRQSFFTKTDTHLFVADLVRVIDAAKQNTRVDPKRIILYGWSEGTVIAAAAAIERPEVAGLILQGPVGEPWRAIVRSWYADATIPYLRTVANGNLVRSEDLQKAQAANGGMVAKLGLPAFAEPESIRAGKLTVSRMLDANHDGALDLDKEALPAVDSIVDFAMEHFFTIYGKNAVPSVDAQVGKLRHMPILLLVGENDASTPERVARTLATKLSQAKYDVQLKVYSGLGHALCPVPRVTEDNFTGPISDVVVNDMANWLKKAAQ